MARVCEQAARIGGRVLLEWQEKFAVREKGPADLVTEADIASQKAIRQFVLESFPSHEFVGEEDDAVTRAGQKPFGNPAGGYRWIVDPLDGTTNYVHKMPNYCTSIALEHAGKIIVAAIYDPNTNECFTANAGQGAKLNGKRIGVSGVGKLKDALVAASFPAKVGRGSPEIARFVEVLLAAQSIRRLGSAALNLCYVACGRLDSYWATSTKAWDVAAGILIVQEAGGVATSLCGQEIDLGNARVLASSTAALHQELLAMLQSVPD